MQSEQWKSLLTHGNDCFNDNKWQKAENFYSEAYDLLSFGYRNNPKCIETMMAWICSCHNLSSLYEKTNKLTLSLKFLTVPHDYLKNISESDKANNDIKLLAIKGLSLTLPPIIAFSKNHPICDDCIEELSSMKSVIEHSKRQMH
ncbi:MAG: hypothetical protein P8I03_12525 [Thalassotalea sp.]|nr:hypothetical protein [Thalassotalea sp.]